MRKELFIAIFLGSFLGIAVAFGIWRFTNSFKQESGNITDELAENNLLPFQQGSDLPTGALSEGITIVQPHTNAVVNRTPIAVSGITMQNSHVVILGDDEYVVRTGNGGTFEQEVEVDGGINIIPIYVFSEDGKQEQTSVLVVYSSEIESIEGATAVMGTVTDITNTSLQIREADGEVSQIALSANTSYASTVQSTRDVEFSDLAIGDFVAALGTTDDDEVLHAARVIIGTLPDESEVVVAYGIIQTLTNREFIVASESEEWSIDATGGRATVTSSNESGEIVTARLAEADEGDRIIVIGTMDDGELQASRIHLL